MQPVAFVLIPCVERRIVGFGQPSARSSACASPAMSALRWFSHPVNPRWTIPRKEPARPAKDDLGMAPDDRQVAAEITLVGALSLPALSTATMAKYHVLAGRFWKV